MFGAKDAQQLILADALASKAEDRDAIDMAVLNGLKDPSALKPFRQTKFVPFDSVHKHTEAEIQGSDGKAFKVTKGAPQVILDMCRPSEALANTVNTKVNEFASKGFRTLGVARQEVVLALLNDLSILTIACDNTRLDPKPVRWNMRRILTLATILGLIGVVETFGILVISRKYFDLTDAQIQSFIYLKLAVVGHMTLFVARTRRPFLTKPYPAPMLLTAILGTQTLAALIVGFGWLVAPIPWKYVGVIWLYCLVWVIIEDWAKLHVYHHLELSGKWHRKFLELINEPLHSHKL